MDYLISAIIRSKLIKYFTKDLTNKPNFFGLKMD
jgi:hypothetical protein